MSKVICYCKDVSELTILAAINSGAKTLKDIQKETGACTGNQCKELNPTGKCCSGNIMELLNEKPSEAPKCCCCG